MRRFVLALAITVGMLLCAWATYSLGGPHWVVYVLIGAGAVSGGGIATGEAAPRRIASGARTRRKVGS